MSAATRVALLDAKAAAMELVERLAPACERIEVAGSIRRGAPDVGDIEIVAIPRIRTETRADGLWGDQTVTIDETEALLERSVADGILEQLPTGGERYTKMRHVATGLQLDLFRVRPPATWGVIFLIRTGPAQFSQWIVTEAKRRSFHVKDGALHRGSLGCAAMPCEVVPTPEESSFLEALGLSYRPPHLREGTWR